jgi:predicted amidohydrolase
MEDFRLALVAQDSPVGQKAENLAHAQDWVRKAHGHGAKLVALPELGITGHAGHPDMVREAEPVPDGPAVQTLIELARELDVYIAAGICEDDRGIHYNTQFIVGPEGYWGKQRKVHLSGDEYFYFRHGTALPVFDLPFARVGVIICFDNMFPELARCLAVQGAELLLAPHAARFGQWPEKAQARGRAVARNKDQWRLVHRCRAYDNGCYVGLCNDAGRSALEIEGVEANHAGGCMVVDPQGEVMAESQGADVQEEMIVVDLEAEAVAARRRAKCFNLQVRRPEVYTVLCKPTS